jgi:hypothetical protein
VAWAIEDYDHRLAAVAGLTPYLIGTKAKEEALKIYSAQLN